MYKKAEENNIFDGGVSRMSLTAEGCYLFVSFGLCADTFITNISRQTTVTIHNSKWPSWSYAIEKTQGSNTVTGRKTTIIILS